MLIRPSLYEGSVRVGGPNYLFYSLSFMAHISEEHHLGDSPVVSSLFNQPADRVMVDYGDHPGAGDWRTFSKEGMATLWHSTRSWANQLKGVAKPWLCWHVSARWCLLQQRVIQEFGWVPIVSGDPRYGEPAVLPGSLSINFNEFFQYPMMLPLFPLEFAFKFTARLAFMHSDLLCRMQVMEDSVRMFEKLVDGEMAAPYLIPGRRHLLNFKRHRYWDLLTCTTRGASESQFKLGAGWWKHFADHPNCPGERERRRRSAYYYDFGSGVAFWKRKLGGTVIDLRLKPIEEGHCTSIGKSDYKYVGTVRSRLLNQELDLNYSLEDVAARLGLRRHLAFIDDFLNDTRAS